MTRWILIIVAVVAVIGIAIYYEAMQGVPVQVATATQGKIQAFVDERAKTSLPATHRIHMPASGRLDSIPFEAGAPVKKGQVVAQMTSRDLAIPVDEAQARAAALAAQIKLNQNNMLEQTAIDESKKILDAMDETVAALNAQIISRKEEKSFADAQYQRTETLFKKGAATKVERDRVFTQKINADIGLQSAQFHLAAAKSLRAAVSLWPTAVNNYLGLKKIKTTILREQFKEAHIELERQQLNQQRGSMTSPVDGVVLEKHVTDAQVLPAGTLVLSIGAVNTIHVEANILTEDAVVIRPGNSVDVYGTAVGDTPVNGKVRRVYPKGYTKVSSLGVEQERVKVIVDLDPGALEELAKRKRKLGVNFRVRVKVYTDSSDHAIIVPRNALFQSQQGKWQLFVVRGSKAELIDVEIGIGNSQQVQIIKGVAAGEQVILAPESSLNNGDRVHPSEIALAGSK